MNILITGGAGFIGSNFVRYLFNKYNDIQIINLDKLTYAGNLANLRDVKQRFGKRYTFVKADINDFESVKNLLNKRQIDCLIHFAAESFVDKSITGPAEFIKTNVNGTFALLEASRDYGKLRKFIQISTDEVYGALGLDSKEKFNEKTAYNPRSAYSASKAAGDHLAKAYFVTYGLPAIVTNCSNNYGPYQHPEKFIPRIITNLILGKKIPIYGDGLYVRDWIHVLDHCAAIDSILQKGATGQSYCVGGNNEMSNMAMAKKLIQLLGKDESCVDYVKDRPGHDRRYSIDSSNIEQELNWKPKFDIEKGLKITVEWYKNNKNWWKNLI